MAETGTPAKRPLSPHLQVYKPMLTMMMSIVHRVTGGALYFGTLLLASWLVALAMGPEYFNYVNELMGSIVGRLILFGYTWALIHHMLGGIRHFIWDTGRGFDLGQVEWFARLTLLGSIVLTILIWGVAYMKMGVL